MIDTNTKIKRVEEWNYFYWLLVAVFLNLGKMKVREVKKMLFNGIEVTVEKLEYSYVVRFPNGATLQIKDIDNFEEIKP